MKTGNLFIKLFISLLFILFILQLFFFIELNFSAERRIHPERAQTRTANLQMLKMQIEKSIRDHGGLVQAKADLMEIISRAGTLYNGQIWIEDDAGTPLLESFPADSRPAKITSGFNLTRQYGEVTIAHLFRDDLKFIYTDIPLASQTGSGLSLHIFYSGNRFDYESKFMMRLSGIIAAIAVLTLSLLQFIRIKVNRLQKSVLRIADGDLSHRVDIRGRGVVEDLARAFNTMTDRLEKMITSTKEITVNISHEIRTPLARIRVVEDLLRKKLGRGEFSGYEKHLDNIQEDIQILDDLVSRLLEFLKLDNFESFTEYEQLDPSALIDDLLLRFEPVIASRELRIEKDFSFSSPVCGNRNALTSALLNLLDNACKYTPERGKIAIRTGLAQGFFVTSVTNSFARLSQKELGTIFTPFERVRQSDNPGSGLGLAITRKIVEKHGGSIVALNSTEGFEIRITLPLH